MFAADEIVLHSVYRNRHMRTIRLIGLLITLFPLVSAAQDTVATAIPAGGWTLEACLEYAKAHNITLNTLRLAKATAGQDVIQAKAAVLPDLAASLSAGVNHIQGVTHPLVGASGSGSVGSSMTLYSGGALRARMAESQLAETSSELDILEAENDLYLQVIQAYNAILLDKETIKYAEDLVATTTQQKTQMEAMYRVGTAARKELVQIEAVLANDQYTLTAARNAERLDKINLKQLLQLPVESDFDIVEPDTSLQPGAIASLESTLETALANRPEVENGKTAVEFAKTGLRIAKAGYLPTVGLNGDIGTGFSNGNGSSLGTQLDRSFYQQVGVSVSIPIFTRQVNKTNTAKADIAVKQAELNLANTELVLSQEVEQAYIAALNAFQQFEAAKGQLAYAEEAYRIAQEELRVETYNSVEFVQQRNTYVQALQAYTQAKYNALLAVDTYEFYRQQRNEYP